jgi:hypothetical protein
MSLGAFGLRDAPRGLRAQALMKYRKRAVRFGDGGGKTPDRDASREPPPLAGRSAILVEHLPRQGAAPLPAGILSPHQDHLALAVHREGRVLASFTGARCRNRFADFGRPRLDAREIHLAVCIPGCVHDAIRAFGKSDSGWTPGA